MYTQQNSCSALAPCPLCTPGLFQSSRAVRHRSCRTSDLAAHQLSKRRAFTEQFLQHHPEDLFYASNYLIIPHCFQTGKCLPLTNADPRKLGKAGFNSVFTTNLHLCCIQPFPRAGHNKTGEESEIHLCNDVSLPGTSSFLGRGPRTVRANTARCSALDLDTVPWTSRKKGLHCPVS